MKIYFDNNASTQLDKEIVDEMIPCLTERYGNPSSGHRYGEAARSAIEKARLRVARLLNCHPAELVFTSGGSESNNMAIRSAISAFPEKKHIISSRVEHASVLSLLEHLKKDGYDISLMPVDEDGGLSLVDLADMIREDTALVSLIGANNETGVLWSLGSIGEICREKGVLFHCDAVQMAGKERLDLEAQSVDYLSVSGHKLHAPKGTGVLYARRKAPLAPLIFGGGQEGGHRGGTENVAGIVGLGLACELAGKNLENYQKWITSLRDFLEQRVLETIKDVIINGKGQQRLGNTSNISFKYCSAAALIQELDERGIAVSAHSACHSGDLDPSHVLTAMGVPEPYLHGTLRISFSRMNTRQEVEHFLDILPDIVEKSRGGFAM